VPRDLPSGTVTFLFTDIQGSTKLLHELGAEAYAKALEEHRLIIRDAFARHGGTEVDTQGDAFFVAFRTAPGALGTAQDAQEALASGPLRVRMGIHTGTPLVAEEGYVGPDVHRAARIAACGHGGQVLVSASTATLVDWVDLRDLGEHRLKDLSAPERIYQLGNAEFPPLKSLHQTNLPIPSTPFLGRDQELGEVRGLLSRDDVHLLTLTGPGGTGKTRLAAHAAGLSSEDYPQGVWWVPLAPLRDSHLVLETAGRAVGAKGGLAAHIGDRPMLMLFDNFEQVVEAAPDVAALIAACPNLDVLVTSREPLHVTGEQEYPVPPLAPQEGVTLFMTRARAVQPDFQADDAVPGICRRLDDLPLALELAAARVKALSPRQILERLDRRLPLLTGGARDLPERQRTLRAAIEWSYDLLSPNEQRLFARLAAFRGGCTLDAAEGVAEADVDTLQSLVDKSLLRHREDRFWMLETIREYAVDRLERSGEAEELRRRHAEHFLALAEEAEPHLRGNPKEWLDRLDPEQDNFRAALDRLEAAEETQRVLRLAAALQRFWNLRGFLSEGRRRLESALAADERPTLARARALSGAGLLALDSGDLSTMKQRSEEALALHLELGDAWGAAVSRFQVGHAVLQGGEAETGQQLFEESVQRFRELGDEHYTLLATHGLAFSYYALGDLDASRTLHEENLRRARETSNSRLEARSLAQLGVIAVKQGQIQDAFSMLERAYRIDREVGEAVQTALDLCRFAHALAADERAGAAVRVLSRAEAFREELGATFLPWAVKLNEETLRAIRRQLDEAAFAEAWEEGRKLTLDEAVALALSEVD
jgi:predicted ATPase